MSVKIYTVSKMNHFSLKHRTNGPTITEVKAQNVRQTGRESNLIYQYTGCKVKS